MLKLWLATVPAETYVPLAIGASVAAIAVLAYLLRYQPPLNDKELVDAWPQRLRLALRIVSAVYVLLAALLLIVALVVGGSGFILTAGLLVPLALGAFVSLWSST
jgi:hypothetical protein